MQESKSLKSTLSQPAHPITYIYMNLRLPGADPAFWMTGLLGPHNHLGGPGACSPGKFLKFGPLKQRFLRSGVTF